MVALVFGGCLVSFQDPFVAHLVVEPEIINLDFGATETFTVTPLDSFGNELDVVDVLDSPYWVVKVDDLDLEIELGTLDKASGYKVIFTALDKPEDLDYLEGKIYVTITNKYGNKIFEEATITIGQKSEEPKDE